MEKFEGTPIDPDSCQTTQSVTRLLWQRRMPPAHFEKMYNFTELAIQLNEFEADVAPTDSRRRPDQRLMEEAQWPEANQEKLRLEEKQRQARRQRESQSAGKDNYTPKWFKTEYDEFIDGNMFKFTQEYWLCKEKQDWSRCDDIF